MNITSQHVSGFVVGVGVAGLGFYLYKKNQPQVDEFLRRQGIQLPVHSMKDYGAMSLEELVVEKEKLEDMIAEREVAVKEETK
ncbi:MAG: hypothetical protein V2J62_07820 [candidate division KSB1 bacterium]|jgi:hypothetical protein|nr:hypothetical protein [candidate division KSB1 bacterium]